MTAKNLFLHGLMVFLLSACGGSSEEASQQESVSTPVELDSPSSLANTINLAGVTGETITTKVQVSGAVAASRGVVGSAIANSQATITLSQIDEIIQGNITFLLSVSDPDGINAVNLVLPSVSKSLPICTQECGTDFEQSVIGLSPYFYGIDAGDLRLEIWITDSLNNQVLADAITFSWQPYKIEGTTVQRDNQTINLSWQANENLNRYNVYLATEAGITPENINDLENGQQFLGLSDTTFSISDTLTDKSYQILITGVDGSGESGFAEVINVAPLGGTLNFAPMAFNDQYNVNEDQELLSNVLTNDTDEYNSTLITNTTAQVSPQHGSVIINSSGEFTYTPRANFNGVDAFSYQVINELGMTDTGIVEITINAVNDAPIALDNTYNIDSDGTLSIIAPGLLANDSDIDLDTLTVDTTPVASPTKGSITLNTDGSFEYIGSANMQGTDSFQYRIVDAQGAQAVANVTINAFDQNSPPSTSNDSYSLAEDTTLVVDAAQGLLANDTDPNDDTFIIDDSYLVSPSHGQLLLATDGSFSYIPDPNYYGIDEFQYQVIDALGATASATATLTINSMPDNPVAQNDEYQFQYNQTLSIATENGLLKNDVNIEPGGLTINTTPVVNVQSGTLTLSNDGSFTYEPNSDSLDVDSFTYSVINEQGLEASAQVILIKTGSNSPAKANNDQYTLAEDSPSTLLNVLENDTDANDDTITLINIANTVGTAQIVNNSIEYTPEPNYFGEVTLSYTISDGVTDVAPLSSTATVMLTIIPINDTPIATPDSASMEEDASPILIDVLANDSDIDGDNLTITDVVTDLGMASVVGNKIEYTPTPNSNGVAIVSYTISDGNGASDSANLQITISPTNDAPEANPDSITIAEDAQGTLINVLSNDTDLDGDNLTISSVTSDMGNASLINNLVQYTPSANANGTATINYILTDGVESDTGTLTVIITPVNDAPTAINQAFSIDENATDGELIGTISATDIENNTLSFSLNSGETGLFNINSASGLLTVNGTRPFDYETATQHTVNVDITDNGSPNETTTITVTVNITDEATVLIPVEDDTFGRPLSGQIDLSRVFSDGEFNDSIELNTNLYFVGYNINEDSDIIIASYSNNGDINTEFNGTGFKTIDFGEDEKATAVISGGGDLFIGYSSFDGVVTEACLLKISVTGVVSTNSGEGNTGTKCTTLAGESVINDLEFTDNKVQGVGYSANGTDKDSLFLKFDISTLAYESGSPGIVDVSGNNRDDEAHAIRNFGNSELLVVGSAIGEENDLDATVRYLLPDGNNSGSFNSGNALILDLSDEEGDDELLAIGGINAVDFMAFLGGYVTHSSGEKEAVIISVDSDGNIDEDIGNDEGIAIYDIDDNSGTGDGGAIITGVKYASMSNQLILSGTTGIDASDTDKKSQLFSARISMSDRELDAGYGDSGINITSNIIGHQSANASTIDENDTLWLSGKFNDSTNEPFITSVTSNANLFTDFSADGYTSLNNLTISSDDQSSNILKLQNGLHANKYISASVAQYNTSNKLVLTRYTNSGIIDTSFSIDGHKTIDINIAFKNITTVELSDGSIVIVGTRINGISEEGFIAKVDQDGNLDDDFATDGVYTTTDIIDTDVYFSDVAIDSGDHIVAVGTATSQGVLRSFATMVKSDGKLEGSFGSSGAYYGEVDEFFETIYIDDNKDIFIAGKQVTGSDSQLLMVKIDDDANNIFTYVDTSLTTDLADRAAKVLADNSGSIYLIANEGTTPNQAVTLKLKPDGTLDTTFALNGVGQYQLASGSDTKVADAALDTSGNIILIGMSEAKGLIARVLADGTIDTSFGQNALGYYQAEQCDSTHEFTSILLQTDTQIVLSSTCFDSTSNNVSISKFDFYADGVKP
ncbi:tandem-95 repeat protein [Pseudoalteromonas sp. MMG006]|uniref:Ig-like domain-containing protein n=1 Tax=Pseudoalteromonas sp. MMG006 TaxID=2822683 RepID=UPI001B363861|nr:Ig-like domain-containing protein [Pseudoalteromonas sp. MMG006]MBQ4799501.1 tandem-95 repeat protein [Pseudoalteromonas sp. MMG006]